MEDHKYGNTLGEKKSHPIWISERLLFLLYRFHHPTVKTPIPCFDDSEDNESERERTGQNEIPFGWRYNIRRNTSPDTPSIDSLRRPVVGHPLTPGVMLSVTPRIRTIIGTLTRWTTLSHWTRRSYDRGEDPRWHLVSFFSFHRIVVFSPVESISLRLVTKV